MFKKLAITTALILGILGLSFATVNAQNADRITEGVRTTGSCAAGSDCDSGAGVGKTVTNIVNLISLIVGIIAVIMIIIAGLMFITASGDSSKVANARNTIIYAAVGLVVVALAQTIVRFVLNRTTT